MTTPDPALVQAARRLVDEYNAGFFNQENNTPRPGLVRMIAAFGAEQRALGEQTERNAWIKAECEVLEHPAHTKTERFGARMVGATRRAALRAARPEHDCTVGPDGEWHYGTSCEGM